MAMNTLEEEGKQLKRKADIKASWGGGRERRVDVKKTNRDRAE